MSARNRKRRPRPAPLPEPRELVTFTYSIPGLGEALYIGEEIRDDDPPEVKEGFARRRLLATKGRCPCGARDDRTAYTVRPPGVVPVVISHRGDCPATDHMLIAAMRRAGGAR